uniref:Rubis-subs-bind domain-containing protein n=1 Tax=Macrostomum lignano TaxID=282301 RepID=A0A1I8IUN7_9PLAT
QLLQSKMSHKQAEPAMRQVHWRTDELNFLSLDTQSLISKATAFAGGSRNNRMQADVEALALRVLQTVANIVKSVCFWEAAIIRCSGPEPSALTDDSEFSGEEAYKLESTHSSFERQRRLRLLCSTLSSPHTDRLVAASNAAQTENAVFSLTSHDCVDCLNACGPRARRLASLLHSRPLKEIQSTLLQGAASRAGLWGLRWPQPASLDWV